MTGRSGRSTDEIGSLRRRLERERKARAEAETIAERATRDLYERHQELRLLDRVLVAANAAHAVNDALQVALDEICAHIGWPVGHVYLMTDDGSGELESARVWHLADPRRCEPFRKLTEVTRLSAGAGLPGRVLVSGEPAWIEDVTRDPNFPRVRAAAEAGIRAGFAAPILVETEVAGVLELFADAAMEPNARLLEIVGHISTQLGRVIERARLEKVTRRAHGESLALFETVFAAAPTGLALCDPELRFVRINQALAAMDGRTIDEHIGRRVEEVLPVLGLELARVFRRVLATGEALTNVEISGETAAEPGRTHHWIASCYPVRHGAGQPLGVGAVVTDITERRETEDRLRESEERFRVLVEAAPNAIVGADGEGRIVLVNRQAEAMFGYAPGELIGQAVERLVPDALRGAHERHRSAYARAPSVRPMGAGRDLRARRKDGSEFPVEISLGPARTEEGLLVTTVIADIAVRKGLEERLAHQALHDSLTDLPNRALFLDRLDHALERSRRMGDRLTVLLIDVDQFKDINDSLGHEVGDQLLVALSPRLRDAMRDSDTVARLGGDEFVVLCEGQRRESDALRLAERLAGAWAKPFTVGSRELFVTASTGIALTSERGQDAAMLLREADAAMYRAKAGGRGRYELYDTGMRERALARLRTEYDLRRALERGELSLAYQPVVGVRDGRPVGVEALLRWNHPERGTVPPADFIPLAEETGLIVAIGQWVLEEACAQLARWKRADPASASLWVSVNLSARQFAQRDIVHRVEAALAASALPPDRLGVEITETVLMEDSELSVEKLIALRALGVKTLVDDFGTGYSSLSYLQRFPLDSLKIDREFVGTLLHRTEPSAIVAAIVMLATALGVRVVAEDVETEAQLHELRRLGCDHAQGYHFAPPLSPSNGAEWIAGQRRRTNKAAARFNRGENERGH